MKRLACIGDRDGTGIEAGCVRSTSTALYEHADPRLGEHPDWGTLVFN